MKKTFILLKSVLTILFSIIIVWFVVYFLWGNQFAIYFKNRDAAEFFPHLLVFATGVSIYGLFILNIHSYKKRSFNILLFFLGLIFSSIPFLLYHGFLQYQNGFWNQRIEKTEILYISTSNEEESVKRLEFINKVNSTEKIDTVFSKPFSPFFELNRQVNLKFSSEEN